MAKSKSKKKVTKRKAQPAKIELTVDRELKRLWTAALRELREGGRDSASGFDRRYESLGRILEHAPPLYLAGGYATARDFLKAEMPGESERSVMRWVRVARFASPADEVRYTVSKLDAVIVYLEKLAGKPLHKLPVALEALRVPIARGAKKARASLADASVAEIRAAARALDRDKRANVPKEAKALAAALRAAKLPEVSVRVQSGKIWIGEVPLESVAALGKALAKLRF